MLSSVDSAECVRALSSRVGHMERVCEALRRQRHLGAHGHASLRNAKQGLGHADGRGAGAAYGEGGEVQADLADVVVARTDLGRASAGRRRVRLEVGAVLTGHLATVDGDYEFRKKVP